MKQIQSLPYPRRLLTMRVTYVCNVCGGSTVTRDAWAEWDVDEQDWVLGAAYDFAFCHDCQQETKLVEVELKRAASR
ncbi:MAG TPA: hypothetical protein VGF77_17545 [Allosphingosinicella sp.]